jgi:hypothetical protein
MMFVLPLEIGNIWIYLDLQDPLTDNWQSPKHWMMFVLPRRLGIFGFIWILQDLLTDN